MGTATSDAGYLQALKAENRRLREELESARETISVLAAAGRSARRASTGGGAGESELEADVERSDELDEHEALERANAELRDLTENLDKIVRRRTQALAESEAQLLKTNEELQRLYMMKQDFVSIAAHELRTPLTSMVGYLELVQEGRFGKLPKAFVRPMASVHRNALRLRRLVEDMLDVSRIESDRMSLKQSDCSLGTICEAVVDELLPLAEMKNQIIESRIEASPRLYADADKLHQILNNLLSNAIRHSSDGACIRLNVDRAPVREYPGQWARFRIRDDGPGIEAQDLERIFEPFSDINPAKHHTSKGPASAGLGLYIARGLVQLHGGIITVASEPEVFTEFTVLLPGAEES
jgi:signal transduction histidine kinase